MNALIYNKRLNWLTTLLACRRNGVASLMLRLKGIGLRAGTSIFLHRKFFGLMEQIAVDREKELDILNEIEAVEKRHRELRRAKRLRTASPATNPYLACEKPAQRTGLWGLLGLVVLLNAPTIKHKNQSLTVD